MRRTMQLFRIQLFNLFPIHEIREPGNSKKRAAVILSIGGTAAALFLCAYNILTAGALAEAGTPIPLRKLFFWSLTDKVVREDVSSASVPR